MDNTLIQVGVGGTFALLVIREVFGFVKYLKNNKSNQKEREDDQGADLPRMARQIDDLHQWHSLTDEEGVKIWYVRRSLEEALRELSSNIRAQTEVLQGLVLESRETRKKVEENRVT